MNYGTSSGNAEKSRTACMIVGIYDKSFTDSAKALDKATDGYLRKLVRRGDIKGKANQVLVLQDPPKVNATRVMLVGLGDKPGMDVARFVGIAKSAAERLKSLNVDSALCCLLDVAVPGKDAAWKAARLAEQFAAAAYQFTDMKGEPPEDKTKLKSVEFSLPEPSAASAKGTKKKSASTKKKSSTDDVKRALNRASALAKGLEAAKNLANTPGNICTPTYIASKARKLANDHSSMTTSVLEEKEMEKLGMGAFMSVSRGSEQPGKLIVMQHKGGKAKDKPHVIVGKGITFDTGGISLKPGAGMHEMIYDMCGAASVFGTMTTVALQKLPINVVGVIAAAENMPSGDASRPGDIVKSMSGQTVEILNTDAEGRLVLCDALTYIEKYNPKTVIDIATLTGACVIALGNHATAMYANDEDLAAEIDRAGQDTHDRVWRMPLWEDYQKQLKSAFADMANIGGREAGSITAACFLARYTKKYRWAHLDIAGTAYQGSGAAKGATGRPVPLLVEYLNNQVKAGKK